MVFCDGPTCKFHHASRNSIWVLVYSAVSERGIRTKFSSRFPPETSGPSVGRFPVEAPARKVGWTGTKDTV